MTDKIYIYNLIKLIILYKVKIRSFNVTKCKRATTYDNHAVNTS